MTAAVPKDLHAPEHQEKTYHNSHVTPETVPQGSGHLSKPQQLDLLNFEDLSIHPASSTPATESAASSGPERPPQQVDYLSRYTSYTFPAMEGSMPCYIAHAMTMLLCCSCRTSQLSVGLQIRLVKYVCSLSETTFGPESTASADPFGPSTFGSTDSGAHSMGAAHGNGFGAQPFSPGPLMPSQVWTKLNLVNG